MFSTSLLFVGGVGPMEMMLVLMLAVLLFGANRLPKLARASGQAMGEFKRGREELENEIAAARTEPAASDGIAADAAADEVDVEDEIEEIGAPIPETESEAASVDSDATPAA